jgi:hypothetical protein
MRARPGGSIATEEDSFQLRDCEGIEVAVVSAIAAALDRVADPIIDERRSANVRHVRREECLPRIGANRVVPGAADRQVAFLEGIREDECAAQRLAVQARAIAPSRARRVNTGIIARR